MCIKFYYYLKKNKTKQNKTKQPPFMFKPTTCPFRVSEQRPKTLCSACKNNKYLDPQLLTLSWTK